MFFASFACLTSQVSLVNLPAGYCTLQDLGALLTKAGVPVIVNAEVASLQYGACLSDAPAKDVLAVLKGDETLLVEQRGGQWTITRSPTIDAIYQAERGRFTTKLRASIEALYQSADKVLQELYTIADRDHRQLAEFDMLRPLKAPLTPLQQLLFDSQRYDVYPRYAFIRFPLLAVQQLGPSGYALSQPQTLWQTWKHLAPRTSTPQRGEFPFYDGNEENGFFGSFFGGRNEIYEVKTARLKALRMAAVTDWDPQDLRASCELLIETPMQTMAGKRYEGSYLISTLNGGIADTFSQNPIKREEVLDANHQKALDQGLMSPEASNGPVPKWKKGRVLASDAALTGAEEIGADIVFPISSFANVVVEPVEGEGLWQMLARSLSVKEFGPSAGANSKVRLVAGRFDKTWDPPMLPRWVAWKSGKVSGFAPDLRCFEPMSSSPLLDITLANTRLGLKSVTFLDLLNAVGRQKVSTRKPSNEQITWCDPIAALPFARLAAASPAFSEMLTSAGISNQRRALTQGEATTLAKVFTEIGAKECEKTVCGQFAAGRLLNESLRSFVLSVKKSDKKCTITITFDEEIMWTATLSLP